MATKFEKLLPGRIYQSCKGLLVFVKYKKNKAVFAKYLRPSPPWYLGFIVPEILVMSKEEVESSFVSLTNFNLF